MDKLLTTKEACEYLGIKEVGTLRRYIQEGKLKAHKLGGNGSSRRHWRIRMTDLDSFLAGQDIE